MKFGTEAEDELGMASGQGVLWYAYQRERGGEGGLDNYREQKGIAKGVAICFLRYACILLTSASIQRRIWHDWNGEQAAVASF